MCVGCWLLVVGCWLLVVGRWLVVGWLCVVRMEVVCIGLMVVVVCWSLCAAHDAGVCCVCVCCVLCCEVVLLLRCWCALCVVVVCG